MENERSVYFPNWSDADEFINRIVDVYLRPNVHYGARNGHWRIRIDFIDGGVELYVPVKYRWSFWTICDEFLRDFVTSSLDPINKALERCFDQRVTTEALDRLGYDVGSVMERYALRYNLSYRDALKGWLGLEPYRSKIPNGVHDRIVTSLTVRRLNGDQPITRRTHRFEFYSGHVIDVTFGLVL